MDFLNRDELLAAAAKPLPREHVPVPELGEGKYLIVQGMTGAQRDAWEKSLYRGRGSNRTMDTENARARLAVRCLVDEHGKRLFQDADAPALGQLRVDVLQRIFEVSQRLSGVSDADLDDLGPPSESVAGNGLRTS